MSFEGKTVIVTGGASGIGLSCAEGFAEKGANVIIADIDSKGEEAASHISDDTSSDVCFVSTDVSSEAEVNVMVRFAMNRYGRIDLLINNAGICPYMKWDELTLENWRRVIDVNLTGMFLCTKEIAPFMKKQKNGRMVFISSTGALVGSHVAHPAYGASKAGVISLMKSCAKEFGPDGILVNAVMPGPIETGISSSFTEEMRKKLSGGTILKRYGKPRDVANAVMFLCSDEAEFITGATLQVSGGEILY